MEILIAVDRALLLQLQQTLAEATATIQALKNLEGEQMLDDEQACAYLGRATFGDYPAQPLSVRTLWAYRSAGLDHYKMGVKTYYKRKDLDAWRERSKVTKSR